MPGPQLKPGTCNIDISREDFAKISFIRERSIEPRFRIFFSSRSSSMSGELSIGKLTNGTSPANTIASSKDQFEPASYSDSRTISSDGSEKASIRSSVVAKPYDEEEDAEVLADFQEILTSEAPVELDRLRELARNGVPSELRGKVWMFCLGVVRPDRLEETSSMASMYEDSKEFIKYNSEVLKRIKGEVKRYKPNIPWFQEPGVRGMFEKVLCTFLSRHPRVEYNPEMVHLLGPLLYCLGSEKKSYLCFEALMARRQAFFGSDCISHRLSRFMALFRNLQPVLCESFEEEEVDPSSWAVPWLQSLLCKALPLPCLLRLWDTYFSSKEGLELHPYVCLSILELCAEQLTEMDSTELVGFIVHLPTQDMNQVISNAYNMKEKVMARNLI